jgi:50S ribosomal protein L16 3-hydroxylase
LDIWFGRFLTEPKPWLRPEPPVRRCTPALLKARLKDGRGLRWHAAARVAWFDARRHCHLFVDGAHYPEPQRLAGLVRFLGDARRLAPDQLLHHVNDPTAQAVLLQFIDAGQLTWERAKERP